MTLPKVSQNILGDDRGGWGELRNFLIGDLSVCVSVTVITQLTADGPGTGEVQVHPQQVQASSGWMVRRRVLNHSNPV